MACPYFYPASTLSRGFWGQRARLPLGDLYAGICRANPDVVFEPEEDLLRECCNLGYAREQCARFPRGAGPDAVRFAVSAAQDGVVRIRYALERDHRPDQHGELVYDQHRQALEAPPENPVLARQAEAYAASFLRRTGERAKGQATGW